MMKINPVLHQSVDSSTIFVCFLYTLLGGLNIEMGKYLPDRIDAINGFKGLLALHILVSEYLVSIIS